MSKLQNDFTTKQQSKELLALGIPRLSANFYYDDENEVQIVRDPEFELQSKGYFPCWSVGRLMEIFDICCAISDYNDWFNTQCVPNEYVAYVIGCYERAIDSKMLDFSKLKEV